MFTIAVAFSLFFPKALDTGIRNSVLFFASSDSEKVTMTAAGGGGGGGGGGIADVPLTWVVNALTSGASGVPAAAATRTYTVVSGSRSMAV